MHKSFPDKSVAKKHTKDDADIVGVDFGLWPQDDHHDESAPGCQDVNRRDRIPVSLIIVRVGKTQSDDKQRDNDTIANDPQGGHGLGSKNVFQKTREPVK